MAKRMLIDASHPEETRVVVLSGNRLEEFDYESASKQQLKGNIYLAKITRVEPSLQAAFVDYGGNRHGFLPFSEIHPDYYRIPIADREALIAAEAHAKVEMGPEESVDDEDEVPEVPDAPEAPEAPEAEAAPEQDAAPDGEAEPAEAAETGDEAEAEAAASPESAGPESAGPESAGPEANGPDSNGPVANGAESEDHEQATEVEEVAVETGVDTVGGDEVEDAARRRAQLLRKYKIQEVIKRRQVILVQITKEERGNKGAAMTTYLSLAGRYCVLMPNTARGGGISRKISNPKDRRRLKRILEGLSIPEGLAVIVRTAGAERTKAEIRRDYEYLVRLWDEIRSTTLASTAPSLIYEEASLIKRSIRDLYQSDMDEILAEGEDGYKAAKAFMRSLMPSHARKVKQYKDETSRLFFRYQVENQIDAMHNPVVGLRSGGYIVMNMTEALVAIDVNSGKATRERHIEETAYKTNLEAAEEIARQLRLRDLAGLIVIDFIDMEETRHNRGVERKLKDAMRSDRARIQLGRISPFGLLEMSRQRLRPSLHESSTAVCRQCNGSGYVRTVESVTLHVLRGLEELGIRRRGGEILVSCQGPVALHILNQFRAHLVEIEQRHDFKVRIVADDSLAPPEFNLERVGEGESRAEADAERPAAEGEKTERKRGRGRRRRKKAEEPAAAEEQAETADAAAEEPAEAEDASPATGEDAGEDKPKRRRRRGKRGGRRRSGRQREGAEEPEAGSEVAAAADGAQPDEQPAETPADDDAPEAAAPDDGGTTQPTFDWTGEPRLPADAEGDDEAEGVPSSVTQTDAPPAPEPPGLAAAYTDTAPETVPAPAPGDAAQVAGQPDQPDDDQPKRRGWWQKWN